MGDEKIEINALLSKEYKIEGETKSSKEDEKISDDNLI